LSALSSSTASRGSDDGRYSGDSRAVIRTGVTALFLYH
jgi:hypothetical protein